MTYILPEIHEKILVRLSVRDVIQCKSVCKSWKSLIRSLIAEPRFIKAHLNHIYLSDCDNNEIVDRRIVMTTFYDTLYHSHKAFYRFFDSYDQRNLLGSSDGLVCISPDPTQVVVVNPSTGEVRNIPKPQTPETRSTCWGFGVDSSMDDYKVVLAFNKDKICTCFQVFSLRSNIWNVIGEFDYVLISRIGVLFKGALHWVAYDTSEKKSVIISFHLSDEKFVKYSLPDKMTYRIGRYLLGNVDKCLCVFEDESCVDNIWVMKDYNTEHSWEFVEHGCRSKYHTVHRIKQLKNYIPNKRTLYHETILTVSKLSLLGAPLFVESLVSPHFHKTSTMKSPEMGSICSPHSIYTSFLDFYNRLNDILPPTEISDALSLEKVKLNDCVVDLSVVPDAKSSTNDDASTSYSA